jgi:ubiquinone/menaquinone biosynthesis C-methylase UbiE
MAEQQIRFTDGAGYERMMGIWSRLAGEVFLDWLSPRPGLVWADIGCGNGAFTELLVERCAPAKIHGFDPSPEQLAYARQRHTAGLATFIQGDAMALPLADASVDAATMALVIFFVPEPARGVAEMARVVRPGGTVSAYAWDLLGGGFPWEPVHAELRALGRPAPLAPQAEASRIENLQRLWEEAGLRSVETRAISVERVFPSFEDFWATAQLSATLRLVLPTLDPATLNDIRERVRARTRAEGGALALTARANAVKGVVPS